MDSPPSWLSDMLDKDAFTGHSRYKVIRHNHKPHVVVAMYRLGASQERVQNYLDTINSYHPQYNPEEPLTEVLEIDYLKSTDLKDYIGKNNGFYTMKKMYEELLQSKYSGDMLTMVKGECAAVIDGPLYSAFHGMISIAYGMAGKSDQTMLEGLIFMNQQYSPMAVNQEADHHKVNDLSKFGLGKTSILEILQKLHENQDLVKKMKDEEERDTQQMKDDHTYRVYGYPGPKYHGEFLLDLTDDLKFPDWFNPADKDMKQLIKMIDWLTDMATIVYVKSFAKNDFFLLHGITAAWCAKYVLPLFDYDTALLGLRGFVAAFLSVYLTQDAPALTRSPAEFFKGEVNQAAWDELIKATLGHDYEMHVMKLVKCLYEAWKRHPESEYASYYFAGANSVKDNPYRLSEGVTLASNDVSL